MSFFLHFLLLWRGSKGEIRRNQEIFKDQIVGEIKSTQTEGEFKGFFKRFRPTWLIATPYFTQKTMKREREKEGECIKRASFCAYSLPANWRSPSKNEFRKKRLHFRKPLLPSDFVNLFLEKWKIFIERKEKWLEEKGNDSIYYKYLENYSKNPLLGEKESKINSKWPKKASNLLQNGRKPLEFIFV